MDFDRRTERQRETEIGKAEKWRKMKKKTSDYDIF